MGSSHSLILWGFQILSDPQVLKLDLSFSAEVHGWYIRTDLLARLWLGVTVQGRVVLSTT